MGNDEYTKKLEKVIQELIRPIKNLPFHLIIKSLSGYEVDKFNPDDENHRITLEALKEVARLSCRLINKEGIKRKRANEVGNDIEKFVKEAFIKFDYKADKPTTSAGKKKSTGYPDLEFCVLDNQYHYLECKSYNVKNMNSSMRTFYLSPAKDFKITHPGIHFIICFEIYQDHKEEDFNVYKTRGWKILDAYNLDIDLKYEFNSDNRRLYKPDLILAEEDI
ncbi:MAG TPA: hypothetical protein PK222_06515 [Bacteroidales bacterium]|jgi:hypothetical protein|nr:hypothetical protein [Bacteroidales bacterium]